MKPEKSPGSNRGLNFWGRLSAAPGFWPAAAWRAIRHVSTQTVTGESVARHSPPVPAESKMAWRLP